MCSLRRQNLLAPLATQMSLSHVNVCASLEMTLPISKTSSIPLLTITAQTALHKQLHSQARQVASWTLHRHRRQLHNKMRNLQVMAEPFCGHHPQPLHQQMPVPLLVNVLILVVLPCQPQPEKQRSLNGTITNSQLGVQKPMIIRRRFTISSCWLLASSWCMYVQSMPCQIPMCRLHGRARFGRTRVKQWRKSTRLLTVSSVWYAFFKFGLCYQAN